MVRDYLESQPYRLLHRFDPRAAEYSVRVEVARAIPDALPTLVAEVIGEAAAALDALASSLSAPASGTTNPVRFPLHESLPEFAQRTRKLLSSMPDEVQATIEEVQPYHTFGGYHKDALWILRELVAAGTPALAAGAMRGEAAIGVNTKRHVEILGEPRALAGPFDDGAVVASVGARVAGPDPKLDLYLRPSWELAFAKAGPARGAPLVRTLDAIIERVQHVIDRLEPADHA